MNWNGDRRSEGSSDSKESGTKLPDLLGSFYFFGGFGGGGGDTGRP